MGKVTSAGIIISLVAGLVVGYFLLPMLFPINAAGQSGTIRQTKFLFEDSDAYLDETNTDWRTVPNTSLSIVTSGNSYLIIRFDTEYLHNLIAGHTDDSKYEFNFTLNGQTLRVKQLALTASGPLTIVGSMTMEYATGVLPANTYNISVNWRSGYDGPTTASEITLRYSAVSFGHNRSLIVQEILI